MKTKITTIILITLAIIMLTATVQANYQSNNGTKVSKSPSVWITSIRNMEIEGQVMGLTEEIDSTTLEATTESNNIDVHMAKNTEWGAMAILSASTEYGKQPTSDDTTAKKTSRYVYDGKGLKTTTGNVYGIYITGVRNWVAARGSEFQPQLATRYSNIYDPCTETKPGDALLYWHERKESSYLSYDSHFYARGWNSIFSFWSSAAQTPYLSRACVVTGQGI